MRTLIVSLLGSSGESRHLIANQALSQLSSRPEGEKNIVTDDEAADQAGRAMSDGALSRFPRSTHPDAAYDETI